MDFSDILQAINLCVKAHNQAEITQGQQFLEKSAVQPGYPIKLMMIADNSELEINIRQFAVADLKNNIKKYWNPKKDKPRFSDEDKTLMRNNLLDALIRSAGNTKLSKLYCKIIYDVCAYDYPTNWPEIVPTATNRMSASENPSEIFGCCLALQQVFDNLQFEMHEKRKTLENIIPVVLPAFQGLISKLMTIYNAENAYILKPMLKVFYMCINLDLPENLQGYDVLSQWLNFLKLLIDSEMEDDFINSGLRNNKNLAMDLVRCICKNTFSGSTYLHKFIQFCANIIDTGANPRSNQPINLAIKDGIFFAIGQLKEEITKDEILKNQLEPLLEKYVIPEFNNANGFIKSRTCWVFGRYGNTAFANNQNVISAVQGITSCMKNDDLPVRFKAALALNSIIFQNQAQEMVKAYLSEILRIYLKLMDEIDSEELVAALEGIVEKFSNDIGPFAYDLCVHLSSAFYKYRSKDNEADNDDDGECQLAAGGCLDAIGKILTSPIQPDVLTKLEDVVIPILNSCLLDDQCDYMEEALYLLQQLTHRAVAISPSSNLWFYYPILIYIVSGKENANLSVANHLNDEQKLLVESAVNGWGPEHTNEIVIVLKNFIQKGGEFFFNANDLFGMRFIDLLFLFVSKVYEKCTSGDFEDDEETCMKNCLTVIYCLLENNVQSQKLSGGVLQAIIQLTLQNLNMSKIKKDVIVANLETLCLCFYYNAQETFSILVSNFGIAIVQTIFQKWFSLLSQFKSDFTKQRLLLAFTSILACPTTPEEIRAITPQILKQCVDITTQITKLREEEDFEDCDDDDDDEDADDGKNFQTALQDHVSKIQQIGKGGASGAADDLDDDEFDDDFDPLDKYHYNYFYNCPLENIDEILVLEQQLINIAQSNPQYYAALTSSLTEEDKHALQSNIALSKKQYEEYLKEKQAKTQN